MLLTIVLCNVNIFLLFYELPQESIPYFICRFIHKQNPEKVKQLLLKEEESSISSNPEIPVIACISGEVSVDDPLSYTSAN
jgi:hypothetical protein